MAPETNGYTNGHANPADQRPLNVAIVGAGIGGLMTAIGFRRNGHNVTLYEQSRFASETGAAIHLCPNANGLMRRYGMAPEEFGAVTMRKVVDYNTKGDLLRTMDLTESSKMWQHPWQLSHRVKLHDTLKERATQENGLGPPAKLYVSHRVKSVDTETPCITLENGEIHGVDLVIGADGVHSRVRAAVIGHPGKFLSSGKAAFRFLISREAALSVEGAESVANERDGLSMWFGDDRRIIMYPCNNNELLNFVCIHPEEESQGSSQEWNKDATVEQVLKVFEGFDEKLLGIIQKADPHSIKVWKLSDMEVIPTFIKSKCALLGDAAHPFLPHQGQGGAVAMEDAVALSVVFPKGSAPGEIADRLKLYNEIRYTRAHAIQEFTRQAGRDYINGKPQVDMMKYVPYNFGFDEYDNSIKMLEKWERARNPNIYRRMPLGFGTSLGPRQNSKGHRHPANDQTFVTASIKFKTSRTFLQNLFPTDSFKFKSPATVAYASFKSTTLDEMSWLGGGGYNHFGLYVHGVTYQKKDGSTQDGVYLPILFENLSDPITTGREELGFPKVFCDLDIDRKDTSYRLQCSWRGAKFATFTIEDLTSGSDTSPNGSTPGEDNTLVYKYIPAVEQPGKADCEYPVVINHAAADQCVPQAKKFAASQTANIKFDALDSQALPTLHHIVAKLAEIPIYEIVSASVVSGTGVPDVSSACRVE